MTPLRLMSAARRGVWLAALLAGVAGCQMAPGSAPGPDAPRAERTSRHDGPPPARMAVAQGAVIIAGPKGFCIDRDASQDRRIGAALTVLSDCRGLGGGLFAPRPAHPAVLTAAVAAAGRGLPIDAAAPDLAAYFASRTGRAALSRAGKAETVNVLESLSSDGAFYLHLTDVAPFGWGAVQPDYWRALLMAGGRTVTVSVLASPEAPLSRDDGLALLREFVAALRAATQELGVKPAG